MINKVQRECALPTRVANEEKLKLSFTYGGSCGFDVLSTGYRNFWHRVPTHFGQDMQLKCGFKVPNS